MLTTYIKVYTYCVLFAYKQNVILWNLHTFAHRNDIRISPSNQSYVLLSLHDHT